MSRIIETEISFIFIESIFAVLKDGFTEYDKIIDELGIDMSNWYDKDIVKEIVIMLKKLSSKFRIKQFSFEVMCVVWTAMIRWFHMTQGIQDLLIELFDGFIFKKEQDMIDCGQFFMMLNDLIETTKKRDLLAENENILFGKYPSSIAGIADNMIAIGTQLPNKVYLERFAINIGVEKSRIKTLKRQEEMRKQREEQAKEDELLLKTHEEAKPVKVSKQQQTKSANKKREQEKREREEYERRSAEAEAERQRQLKKKQQQKQAKKKA